MTDTSFPVVQNQVAQAVPALAGGTVETGTYHRTADTVYTGTGGAVGPTGFLISETLEITGSGGVFTLQSVASYGTVFDEAQTFTLTPGSGGDATYAQTCPLSNSASTKYEATGTGTGATLQILLGSDRVVTYTKL